MGKLVAKFEQDRTLVGGIYLYREPETEVAFYSALGKAAMNDAAVHGNPLAWPEKLYGDTPTGVYEILSIEPTGLGTSYPNTTKYGTAGVIKLNPIDGEALTAKQNGRTGILVHGGAPGSNSLLRRTNGCIRMMDSELEQLISQIRELAVGGEETTRLEVIEFSPSNYGSCDSNGECGEGDPPAGF